MDDIKQLLTIEAIKQLKARYFICLDLKDWSGLRELFMDDATFDVLGARKVSQPRSTQADPLIEGADAFVAYARERLGPIVSAHYGHMPVIDIISDHEASGIWAMEDWLYSATGTLHGQGHYHETYRKSDGCWRIQTLRLTRLHVASTM
ncbi:nuclear transport factor 2 family protein [Noviherbaspirillum sedimenti]|uniref:Nuclear transport factor 2 family protein n=1 Tax=Noviherbaspirillum sedimenti TaxID=2320865 RepID=A0A3A3G6W8_9BURK|nr:nuclear transport factor 2 family protein [Noviherbaspirillum sedimenti]RJG03385.1 nuclear transport factor 2 family protein [Noviherbaspirillum sedimenti]